jgi:signal transduction histidine kinase
MANVHAPEEHPEGTLERIFALLTDGVILLDEQGAIVFINASARRTLGLEGPSATGRRLHDLPATANSSRAALEVFSGLSTIGIEARGRPIRIHTGSNQCARMINVSVVECPDPTLLPHHPCKQVLILQEAPSAQPEGAGVAPERRSHNADTTDALASLAQAIAHEIRNPVTVIGGFARLLQRHHAGLEYVSEIIQNSQRLESLVQEVSDFASLPPVRFQEEDPVAWLQEVIASYTTEAAQHRTTLRLMHQWPDGLKLRLDLLLMRKVMGILLENAFEAMEGGGEICVSLARRGDEGLLEVEDSGRGIESRHLPYVFRPFFTTKPKALGLGLAKAERILAKHGGGLEVHSGTHRGTRVVMWIPLTPCADPASTEAAGEASRNALRVSPSASGQ